VTDDQKTTYVMAQSVAALAEIEGVKSEYTRNKQMTENTSKTQHQSERLMSLLCAMTHALTAQTSIFVTCGEALNARL